MKWSFPECFIQIWSVLIKLLLWSGFWANLGKFWAYPGKIWEKWSKWPHNLPDNHEMIISWKFLPNSTIFDRLISINMIFHFLLSGLGVNNGSKKRFSIFFFVFFWVRISQFTSFFFGKFGQMGFFPKNRAPSLFYVYGSLTSCKKPGKSLEPILRKSLN